MMLQIAELAQIRQQRLKETNQEMPKAQDGLPTFLPPGSKLPDFFGFDKNLNLKYRGRLDSSGMQHVPDANRDLFHAMVEIAETGKMPENQQPSIGCSIKWMEASC